MNLTKLVLHISSKLRPVLLRILPHKLLRLLKRNITHRSFDKMNGIKIDPFDPSKYKKGINLIGNIKAETGLGQSCRLVANELLSTNLDFSIYHYNQLGTTANTDQHWDDKITTNLPYNINLIHINPHELGLAFMQLDQNVWNYRYNIAFWLWELEEFPDEWVPCFSCLDEIWTPSEFISNSIRKKTNLPVTTVPYCVNATVEKEYNRNFFGIPNDQFLFLTMYDHNSIIERKNPQGTFEAFKRAFNQDNVNVGLVIKINNADKNDIKLIRSEFKEYSNIYLLTSTYDRDQINSLIKCCDVVVSLHRAEGFGLVLAEAMQLGTPTIATNWSSNTEFMNPEVACMVDFKLIEINHDMGPFKKGNRWADPDIIQAADYMKRLFYDNDFYQKLTVNAEEFIKNKLNMKHIAGLIINRLDEILRTYNKK